MPNNAKQSLHEYLVNHRTARDAFRGYIAEQCKLLRNDLEFGPEDKVQDVRAELRATRKLWAAVTKAEQKEIPRGR